MQGSNPTMPICLAQVMYKILSLLITSKVAGILRLLTNKTQYGYRNNLSAIDAIMKTEQHLRNLSNRGNVILMDLTKALGTVNRTI